MNYWNMHATTQMKLEHIMLSEKSKPEKTRYVMIQFTSSVQNKQIYIKRLVAA